MNIYTIQVALVLSRLMHFCGNFRNKKLGSRKKSNFSHVCKQEYGNSSSLDSTRKNFIIDSRMWKWLFLLFQLCWFFCHNSCQIRQYDREPAETLQERSGTLYLNLSKSHKTLPLLPLLNEAVLMKLLRVCFVRHGYCTVSMATGNVWWGLGLTI